MEEQHIVNKQSESETIQFRYITRRVLEISFIALVLFNYILLQYIIQPRFRYLTLSCTFIIPAILVSYSYYYHTILISSNNTKSINELKKEFEFEIGLMSAIPTLLFGLGVIYTQFKRFHFITSTIPFLLLSVIFGSILPVIVNLAVFDKQTSERLLIADELNFTLISISLGTLTAALMIPLYMYANDVRN